MPDELPTLLCLSHLPWEHVWQRPQHLMSRFARHHPVIFVDPPERTTRVTRPQLMELDVHQDVRVIRPLFPEHLLSEESVASEDPRLGLLPEILRLAGPNTILWVSSPLSERLVDTANPDVLLAVYDCMDDLASFQDGNSAMRSQEERLMRLVQLVFTGGRSMYEARKDRHSQVHCFPSGVDVAHYHQVHDLTYPEPGDIEYLQHPRLGYFGVLDERIDWPLIAEVAQRRPTWQWVLVGPTAKIDPSKLPAAPNIHYCGQQPYAALPGYLKSFDLATMPFALNDTTRYISPTKTLEYLAGGRSVISTSVPDVVASYPGIVSIADGVDAWIDVIEELLTEQVDVHRQRLDLAQPLIDAGSWDGIADRMWGLIEERIVASPSTDFVYEGGLRALER